jgi:hypothetical protein
MPWQHPFLFILTLKTEVIGCGGYHIDDAVREGDAEKYPVRMTASAYDQREILCEEYPEKFRAVAAQHGDGDIE